MICPGATDREFTADVALRKQIAGIAMSAEAIAYALAQPKN